MAYTTYADQREPRVHHIATPNREGLTLCGIPMPESQLQLPAPPSGATICPDCGQKYKQLKGKGVNIMRDYYAPRTQPDEDPATEGTTDPPVPPDADLAL